ncbi:MULTISPECIES: VOC family protein [Luteimonas]|uniref:VOC family protein n=1 Tax=Luteimonas TaxID=83614 RepID=UPI000C7A5F19|nr:MULTISPECIES: VOC family protein [Luteimonas]
MQPFAIEAIDHVVLRVRDLPRAVAFYTEVVGCTLARRRDDLGLVHLRAGASMLDLVDVAGRLGGGAAPDPAARNVDHVCLRIAPFDEAALVAHLARHGVQPRGPADANFGAQGDGLSLYIDDPEGNGIEFKAGA